jgi:hypothetical protein
VKVNICFGGTYCLHFQGRACCLLNAGFLFGILRSSVTLSSDDVISLKKTPQTNRNFADAIIAIVWWLCSGSNSNLSQYKINLPCIFCLIGYFQVVQPNCNGITANEK